MNSDESKDFFSSGAAGRVAAVLAFLAVLLGAMGAHALDKLLHETEKGPDQWRTAAHYHLVHAAALYFLALHGARCAYWLMLSGIVLFSGSIYLIPVTKITKFGAVAPVGGLLLMASWLLLALRPLQQRR
jgi:uncharacterized membrane protein YgdD (TMEM256/DUF423 family)